MIKYIIIISICLASNPVDNWIKDNSEVLKSEIKSASFKVKINSNISGISLDSVFSSKILIGNNNSFRLEVGPRTVISDGKVWKSYDLRTNQIFI